jgi:hypothetical protein
MLIASLRELIYLKNEDLHTISYSKFCNSLEDAATTWVNSVIAEDNEQAVQMLREEVQKYLCNEFKEKQYVINYDDFKFEVHSTEVIDNRFNICFWSWDKNTYPVKSTQ